MLIKTNNMLYDSTRSDCKCILAESQGQLFAFVQFVQMVDTGEGGEVHPIIKRFWGFYDHKSPAHSIQLILEHGGEWPALPM